MYCDGKVWVGIDKDTGERAELLPSMANRHGLIAGATGTGKTVTLKLMAEDFSSMGVPVFLSDVKGDLSGMLSKGAGKTQEDKKEEMGLSEKGYSYQSYPAQFWDIEGKKGLPVRTSISEFGPMLLSRVLGITDLQSDILNIVFRIADENSLLLIDTKDLKAMLQYVSENAKSFSQKYGNMAPQSINAILRAVVALEGEGGDRLFGEPSLDIMDLLDEKNGKGMINILQAEKTITNGRIYSTFMLYLMTELFQRLDEKGDPEKPCLVFFFDEAHLLFKDASKVFLEKTEQLVKLIRSKGVGVYFITQNPSDIPDGVLNQLGNKVQHALRAYTPSEMKKIKSAAQSYRENPAFNTEEALQELGTGEAVISFLDEKGRPSLARRCSVLPPQSKIGPDDSDIQAYTKKSYLYKKYGDSFDRESAYEILKAKETREEEEKISLKSEKEKEKEALKLQKEKEKEELKARKEKEKTQSGFKKAAKSAGRTALGSIGREVAGNIGESIFGKNSSGKRVAGNIGAAIGRGILDTLFK